MMKNKWWQEAVVYQVYPRSFQDSDGDGMGDIPGIIQRLPYLKKLGIDVIWLSPVYKSPNADNGYDISDYQAVQPAFGSMADIKQLFATAHELGLKIMMDLVVNHTSDEHEWFQQSRQSKDNPYRDFYIWRDPVDGHEPNNWASDFGGSAWEFDAQTGQYYLHIFSKKQPDLNWENPKLRQAIYDMMNWWLEQGVDGFRMDVINLISKDMQFPDDPSVDFSKHSSSMEMVANGPRVHEFLREMNEQVLSKADIITVGETPGVTPADAIKYTGFDAHELQMVFQFEHTVIDDSKDGLGKWSDERFALTDLKRVLSKWQVELDGKAWNSLYWNNHDRPRVVSRFGDDRPEYHELSAKMLGTVLHFMQGTPYIYQGEEIGMTNIAYDKITDYQDIDTLNAYQDLVVDQKLVSPEKMMTYVYHSSRDNARTPMQWDTTSQAGFSTGTPWLKVNENYPQINVEKAVEDSNSIFYYYQQLIALRHELPIMTIGHYELLEPDDAEVYMYKRVTDDEELLVIANFTDHNVQRDFVVPAGATQVISNYDDDTGYVLRPYEAKVYRYGK